MGRLSYRPFYFLGTNSMALPKLKLISFSMCAYVQRARIVLLEKKLPHDIEYIDLSTPPDWFYDVSPLEKVPVLLVDDAQPVFESMVICDYLDEISDGSLYPADPLVKARQRAWIAVGDEILDHFYSMFRATDEKEFKRHNSILFERLDAVEESIAQEALFGSEDFCMVDVVFAPLFRFLHGLRDYAGLDGYADTPLVADWAARLLARPSVMNAVPDSFTADLPVYLQRFGGVLATLIKSHVKQ